MSSPAPRTRFPHAQAGWIRLSGCVGAALCLSFWAMPEASAVAADAQADEPVAVFERLVQPILDAKCISCHGDDKQKAGLRVDSYDELMFGSEFGPVVVAGKPHASSLIQVLHLPEEHDRHMPPPHKEQLSAEDIDILSWWVRAGAKESQPLRGQLVPSLVRDRLRAAALAPSEQAQPAEESEPSGLEQAGEFDSLVYETDVEPLLRQYCFDCHGESKQKGDIRLDTLDPDILHGPDAEGWHTALDMINGAEMPPRRAPQPSDEERRIMVGWMTESLDRAAELRRGELQTVVRRLNKEQYTFTLQQLLGLGVDFGRPLPDDAKSHMGFSNNGEVLQASQLHLETYQQIARRALEKAIVIGERPDPIRYRVTFGKGMGMNNVAAETGGYQSVPLPTADFLLEALDADGQVIVPASDTERKELEARKRKISVGLRGSQRSRFKVVEEGMTLYGALPHREVAPGSWQGPSPNVKLEMQRVFPEEGDFVMRVTASRGELFSSDDRVLIALEDPQPLAFSREGTVIPAAGAFVFHAADATGLKNLRRMGDALLPENVPADSAAKFTLELEKDSYVQIDMVHPAAAEDAMPSVRLALQGLTLDKRFQLTGAQLDQERIVSGLGSAFLPAGKHELSVGGKFFVGFEQLIVTPIPEGHPAVAPLQEKSAAQAAEAARRVPSLRAFVGTRTDDGMDYANFGRSQEVRAPLGSPQTYEFFGRLENLPIPEPESGDTEILSGFSLFGVWNDHLVKNSRDPGPPLLVESIEVEAPYYEQWPPASHQAIFFASDLSRDDSAYAHAVLHRFMERAFRRPVAREEVDRYHAYWLEIRNEFDSFEESIQEVLIAVLCSPNFLFLAEPEPTPHVLAARLSYFLWNSPPDEQLLELAEAGALEDQLAEQVDRMLDHPQSWRFVRSFAREWLRLDRHALMTIDVGRFPAYTRFVKRDMAEETYHFLHRTVLEDLPIATLIDSDFAMLNQNLAEFYGIPGVEGNHFRPVPIDAQSGRGGLLSQGAFLAGHSDGRQPHPIKRAVWVKEKILGDEPPAPPPNVPALDPETPGFEKLTLKEQLEKHRDNPSCHDCHAGIDPFGVAFERYNAVGLLEDTRNGRPIDASTVLPDGTPIQGVDELKRYLLESQHDTVIRALAEHLFAYALGRDLSFADEAEISQIVDETKANGSTMRALIRAIAMSSSFTIE